MKHKRLQRYGNSKNRRGAAAVEFAIVAPIFVMALGGLVLANRIHDAKNQFMIAAREGARLAAMDRDGMLSDGQTTNDKIINDVKNYLEANNYPADKVKVIIADPNNRNTPFDLDDPNNNLKNFQLIVELDYSELFSGVKGFDDHTVGARAVFRNARAAIIQ